MNIPGGLINIGIIYSYATRWRYFTAVFAINALKGEGMAFDYIGFVSRDTQERPKQKL